jgi:iron uptake system EfeUOB component EfeO/EfeM
MLAVVAVAIAVIAVLVGSALSPGGLFSGGRGSFGVRSLAGRIESGDPLGTRLRHVYDSSIAANRYGSQISQVEDQGFNASGAMTSDLSPIPASEFRAPVNAYLRYAASWLVRTEQQVGSLGAALRGGDRQEAQAQWKLAWSDYLHLGAVYGLFGNLDQEIDGSPGGLTGGASSPQFSGFHRLELGLWTGRPLGSLEHWSALLALNIRQLQRTLPHTRISPLDYATRAHEILEDAQRDLMNGVDVEWSGQGPLGTAAGIAATDEVIKTLVPLLSGRDNTLAEVQDELLLLAQSYDRVRREHHGVWPSLSQLTMSQRELLDGSLTGALNALQLVPGTLETTAIPVIPSIPKRR